MVTEKHKQERWRTKLCGADGKMHIHNHRNHSVPATSVQAGFRVGVSHWDLGLVDSVWQTASQLQGSACLCSLALEL